MSKFRLQFKYGKLRTRKNSVFRHLSRSVGLTLLLIVCCYSHNCQSKYCLKSKLGHRQRRWKKNEDLTLSLWASDSGISESQSVFRSTLQAFQFSFMFSICLVVFSLCEKCPNTEFLLFRIFPYSIQIRKNTDQKKLRIWTLFTQCLTILMIPRVDHKSAVFLLISQAWGTRSRFASHSKVIYHFLKINKCQICVLFPVQNLCWRDTFKK